MKRTWTIIGVADVARSFKWYQSLFGQPPSNPAHDYFGQISDTDGTVLLCLHRWGAHEHPSLSSPDHAQPGNGLLLFFRVDDFDDTLIRARDLVARLDEEPQRNPNTGTSEFALRDPDGYRVMISALGPHDASRPNEERRGTAMIDHTGIGVANVAVAAAFYDAALGALGMRRVMQLPEAQGSDAIGYGFEYPIFWIDRFHPHGVKQHTAFVAQNRGAVDAFYAAALKAGGTDNGGPGIRPPLQGDAPGYYAAFVFDPDGNNIEAVFRDG